MLEAGITCSATEIYCITCIFVEEEDKYVMDGEPRGKRRKRRSKVAATCPFLKPVTLENFKDMALVCVIYYVRGVMY